MDSNITSPQPAVNWPQLSSLSNKEKESLREIIPKLFNVPDIDALKKLLDLLSHCNDNETLSQVKPPQEEQDDTGNAPEPPCYYFLHLEKKAPFECLQSIFDAFDLHDIIIDWDDWVELALCIEEGSYDDEDSRSRLFKFSRSFKDLTEALYKMLKERVADTGQPEISFLRNNTSYYSHDGRAAPEIVRSFTMDYTRKDAQKYLWFVLESVLNSTRTALTKKFDILFNYEAFLCLVKAAYRIRKLYPELF